MDAYQREDGTMNILYIIALVLLAFWIIGAIFEVAGGLIHLLLLVAAILIVYRLFTGRRGKV